MLQPVVRLAILCLLAAPIVAAAPATQDLTRRDADSLEKKIAAILARAGDTRAGLRPLRTPVTDREVNAYFRHQGAAQLPLGIVNPVITLLEGGRVAGTVTVDLDTIRKSKVRAWNDPMTYMSGSVEITVAGLLRAANGFGSFTLETATLGGVSVPKVLLQEIVSFYTKTPELPTGLNIDEPFTLPQRIVRVEFQRGSATIVQ